MGIKIRKYLSDFIDENTYLVTDEATGYSAVIDPGYYGEDIEQDIGDCDNLKYIILTHGHGDHIRNLSRFKDNHPSARIVAHENERVMLENPEYNGTATMPGLTPMIIEADEWVSESSTIMLGDSKITFIATPGHTVGGMCIMIDGSLFSGDTLFFMSVGATHFYGGSWDDLKVSIRNKLFCLDNDVTVYPGHGPKTSIGYEKRANPFV